MLGATGGPFLKRCFHNESARGCIVRDNLILRQSPGEDVASHEQCEGASINKLRHGSVI